MWYIGLWRCIDPEALVTKGYVTIMPLAYNDSKIPAQKLGNEQGDIPEIKVKTAFNGWVFILIKHVLNLHLTKYQWPMTHQAQYSYKYLHCIYIMNDYWLICKIYKFFSVKSSSHTWIMILHSLSLKMRCEKSADFVEK